MLGNGDEIEGDTDATYWQEEGPSCKARTVADVEAFHVHDHSLVANEVH